MTTAKRTIIALTVLLGGLALAACSNAGANSGGSSTYTLSGTVSSPTGATVKDGTYVYLKLVAASGSVNDSALYWTRAAFSSGVAKYSVSGISAGSYTGFAFIDMDGNAADNASAAPDTGDWVTQGGSALTISGDETSNLDANVWTQL